MPKYIRTEKGIYEVVEDSNKEWGKQIVVKFPKNLNMKLADVKDQIIAQSNNLAELCDEFVQTQKCFGGEIKYWILPKLEGKPIETVMEGIKYHLKDGNIFGCIWTSKGLIYVAKMNENGVLELI